MYTEDESRMQVNSITGMAFPRNATTMGNTSFLQVPTSKLPIDFNLNIDYY